ncbi:hypothetical protein IQ07DRAFT_677520 [Pyrenochaeta sp. DS3sAY3a]|nr:hypothetical protein IQ07DRAFT_677520 [Pyrenochaeta sp. DS3sAY3a]
MSSFWRSLDDHTGTDDENKEDKSGVRVNSPLGPLDLARLGKQTHQTHGFSSQRAWPGLDRLTPPPNVSTAPPGFEGVIPRVRGSVQFASFVPADAPEAPTSSTTVCDAITLPAGTTELIAPPTVSTAPPPALPAERKAPDPASSDLPSSTLPPLPPWTKMQPISPDQAMLRPLKWANDEPKDDEPLFPGPERLWYLGFLERWSTFNKEAINFYQSELFFNAFNEIRGCPIAPPRASWLGNDAQGDERLTDLFNREVLEVVNNVCNKLLNTKAMNQLNVPSEVVLGRQEYEESEEDDFDWEPKFIVRAMPDVGDQEIRLIGHAEYLGGRPGALSWAVKERAKNSWGSLRCVLGKQQLTLTLPQQAFFQYQTLADPSGKICQWMMMGQIRYGFLVSNDEIMFLRCEPIQKIQTVKEMVKVPVNVDPRGKKLQVKQVKTFVEPWMDWSDPIKITDVLDVDRGTIPVKLAMLYFLHLSTCTEWKMPDRLGSSLKYFAKTKAGENWKPAPLASFPVVPPPPTFHQLPIRNRWGP